MRKLIAAGAVTLLALTMSIPSALAGNNDVIQRGSCNGSGNWKLKLSPDDRGMEVEFEVDRNVSGEQWRVVLKRDGDRFFATTRTTQGASGSFEVRKVVGASSGDFVAKGRHIGTEHTCTGRASI